MVVKKLNTSLIVLFILINFLNVSLAANNPPGSITKIKFKVTMPQNFDMNCINGDSAHYYKYNRIGIFLNEGILVYANIQPNGDKGCKFTVVTKVNSNRVNNASASGNTTLVAPGGALLPGCANRAPFVLRNGATLRLGKGGVGFDCPTNCSKPPGSPPKPCGN